MAQQLHWCKQFQIFCVITASCLRRKFVLSLLCLAWKRFDYLVRCFWGCMALYSNAYISGNCLGILFFILTLDHQQRFDFIRLVHDTKQKIHKNREFEFQGKNVFTFWNS